MPIFALDDRLIFPPPELADENGVLAVGGDLSIALGPLGKGLEASTTTNLDADVYAFSTAVGAFAGGALEGAAFIDRQSYNDQYYSAYAPAREIVVDRKFYNGHADPLRAALP